MNIFILLFVSLSSFSFTDYEDLLSWKEVPVRSLNEHSYWKSLHYISAQTPQKEEIRVYMNKVRPKQDQSCLKTVNGLKYVDPACSKKAPCLVDMDGTYQGILSYLKCSRPYEGCDNIFIIEDQIVKSYQPVGHCFTTANLRPEKTTRP